MISYTTLRPHRGGVLLAHPPVHLPVPREVTQHQLGRLVRRARRRRRERPVAERDRGHPERALLVPLLVKLLGDSLRPLLGDFLAPRRG
eukprot:30849-Pelagococcus_subviridis.AAC.6